MSDINVLIVVDGIFNLSMTYPVPTSGPEYGPDTWFTVSHLISTLRGSASPTFTVDTASRGLNAAGAISGSITNDTADPAATLKGPNPSTPTPFRFDDPSVDLSVYDEIWLFGFEGYDYGALRVGPGNGEPGALAPSELVAITNFMQAGGGVFAVGDHDGLGSGMCGNIPRVRYMRKWFALSDPTTGMPPLTVRNWPGGTSARVDTLQKSATDSAGTFFFDDQSDDIPQKLTVLVPTHPAVQRTSAPLAVYPDHMHEGEVIVPTGAQLMQTGGSDTTLSFAGAGFTEFPTVGGHQEVPVILAQCSTGTPGSGGTSVGHVTLVGEGMACENNNFFSDSTVCNVVTVNAIAAYDGHAVNVGRIATDSSFHHYLDLNLLGDPCSNVAVKQQGFNASIAGQAVLRELEAYYVNMASWLAWNDRRFYFMVDKSTFGRDEVADSPSWKNAFWLVLEGYAPNWLAGAAPNFSTLSTFKSPNIMGLSIGADASVVQYELGGPGGAYGEVVQRIRFAYDVTFSSTSSFPSVGSSQIYTLLATIAIGGAILAMEPETVFELVGGSDPYFTNVDSTNPKSVAYLSQDLRVFTVTAGEAPISGAVAFTSDPYASIQGFLYHLNNTSLYTQGYPSGGPDPLNSLPNQTGYETGDTSVMPLNGSGAQNYNFAIARVRLQGAQGTSSSNVRVFFRLWVAVSCDTDFQPGTTYLSQLGTSGDDTGLPIFPEASGTGLTDPSGQSISTIPFFATGSTGSNDYDAGYVPPTPNEYNNIRTVTIPAGQDSVFAYFGCYLDVYNALEQSKFPGTHHCIVAQIAYDDAPIPSSTPSGATPSPENSDKLAQRNLQITSSGNPGFPVTHRIPQTFDTRPSPLPIFRTNGELLNYPDELMIDWGNTPAGSVASIYWPQLSAPQVLDLASKLYSTHGLSAADGSTIQCTVTGGVTYIPIPNAPGQNLAGLFTVDLPANIRAGNEFDVVVRRVTSRQSPVGVNVARSVGGRDQQGLGDRQGLSSGRCVAGTFVVKIPVSLEEALLRPEENTLAILKWRLQQMPSTYRWYPVVQRYIAYISSRVKGMGGDPTTIAPSQWGVGPPVKGHGGGVRCPEAVEFTGKVAAIVYDRFGDFDGFVLLSLAGHEHVFRSREQEMGNRVNRAWEERILITVFADGHDHQVPKSIVYRVIRRPGHH